jgi:hypothetical protein
MKTLAEVFLAVAIGLALAFVSVKVHGQDQTFPVDTLLEVRALFCVDKESAVTVADNQGKESDDIDALVALRKCLPMVLQVKYQREVYKKGKWSVWELSYGRYTIYEATNWRPKKKPTI